MEKRDTVNDFAERIDCLLRNVLCVASGDSLVKILEGPDAVRSVISNDEVIDLTVDSKPVLGLAFSFSCTRSPQGFLTVEDSSIILSPSQEAASSEPFFHYDYVRDHRGDIPAAHINIHASNDSLTRVMLQCGLKKRGKRRRKDFVDRGVFPTVSTLHFPLGGNLFRPSLEDVLEMAVYEFGIDTRDDWHEALVASRLAYRTIQYRALVRDRKSVV